MNFIFISPQFPENYRNFCQALRSNGINVLGIADQPYESLSSELRECLTEYYRVGNMENYDEMYRAVAFYAFKYGKIDWIESNNEYWLEQDARLRTDFNVRTGIQTDRIGFIKAKSLMKECYRQGHIPTARQIKTNRDRADIEAFVQMTGYPLIAKPDIGVGAGNTHKIEDAAQLADFFANTPNHDHYVLEEFMSGFIYSYDAIVDSQGDPVFESMGVWPPSIMDIVNDNLELTYYETSAIDPQLREIGRNTVKAFGVNRRFVHLEFFRLDRDHPGLGDAGSFAGLEVNMRPAGGYTPDMMNFAHSCNVYQIWADMVAFDDNRQPNEEKKYCCAYASRRDMHSYAHSHQQLMLQYDGKIMQHGRVADVLSGAMGNYFYLARLDTPQDTEEFIKYATEHAS